MRSVSSQITTLIPQVSLVFNLKVFYFNQYSDNWLILELWSNTCIVIIIIIVEEFYGLGMFVKITLLLSL